MNSLLDIFNAYHPKLKFTLKNLLIIIIKIIIIIIVSFLILNGTLTNYAYNTYLVNLQPYTYTLWPIFRTCLQRLLAR